MADENLHKLDELGNEENEREDEKSEESVADHFAGYVAVEKTHGQKGECNMGEDVDGGRAVRRGKRV
jgi:hypothetical protein